MSEIAPTERAAPNVMDTTPGNQAATFRNQDQVWPVRAIRCGEAVRALPPHGRSLSGLTYRLGDLTLNVDDYVARHRTAGLLILKGGEIALERYGMGNVTESLWTGFAATTALTGTLAGAALHDGAIGSLDDPCDFYLPELLGSAYEGVTIRNLLRMCSGVAWREDYDNDARSDAWRLGRAMARRRPGAVLDLLCHLPRVHPQGAIFNHSTGDSCVLAAVVAAATGRPLADYLAERVWGPGGMEADGHWQLEWEDGLELGGFGVSARLRDMGRFGLLMLEDGEARDGRRVLPRGWRELAGRPDSEATAFGALSPGDPGGYGYHWWATPPTPGAHAGVFAVIGAFGQFVYINPGDQVVAAIQSAWRKPQDAAATAETVTLLRAAVRALRQAP
ncbi:CubicO group peptidase (beta-lactamase class C family) [Caulobacter ginsengisoli]|uniref:CubicO group peptidase (Beta-lactamase class C family) n=1 Tax=Caulobacter ginsengisoli TaxID=400775 RepID=A0ABU0IQG3_9CAUL|nr:serine hydrolase [Caulobacter ginsengisoli]MDQ0464255.1 CubicO group peptidase (beta-lactamase class C family) [Caulobacter ginsengisoli]